MFCADETRLSERLMTSAASGTSTPREMWELSVPGMLEQLEGHVTELLAVLPEVKEATWTKLVADPCSAGKAVADGSTCECVAGRTHSGRGADGGLEGVRGVAGEQLLHRRRADSLRGDEEQVEGAYRQWQGGLCEAVCGGDVCRCGCSRGGCAGAGVECVLEAWKADCATLDEKMTGLTKQLDVKVIPVS